MKVKSNRIVKPVFRSISPPTVADADDEIAVRLRKAIGYGGGQRAIAGRANLHASLISRYLQDGASRKIDVLRKIAHAAGVREEWLLAGIGSMESAAQPVGIAAARPSAAPASSMAIDPELLKVAIEGVETALELEDSQMDAADKAELILKICGHFAEAPRPRLATVIRLVKGGSMRRIG